MNNVPGGETVLVVDDQPAQASLAKLILEKAGYVVLAALSGGEAMLTLESLDGAVDLLVTDVRMPGLRGPELVDDMRKKYPAIKVLFVSAANIEEVVDESALVLSKPYAAADLLLYARRALARDF